MTLLERMLMNTDSAVILGHVRPDGDCVGAALGLYSYIRSCYPAIRTAVYLEEASPKFSYLKGFDEIRHQTDEESWRLCICVDSSDRERLGEFVCYLDRAEASLCLDHHVTNTGYAQHNVVDAQGTGRSMRAGLTNP